MAEITRQGQVRVMDPDALSGEVGPSRAEPRWPVALSIVAVLALLIFLPDRVRLLPPWPLYCIGPIVLTPMAGAAMRPQSAAWQRIEQGATFAFVVIAGAANLATLRSLVVDMIQRSQTVDGLHLLSSSVAVWATNVLMFSLHSRGQLPTGSALSPTLQSKRTAFRLAVAPA
jgi:hypothetical protein